MSPREASSDRYQPQSSLQAPPSQPDVKVMANLFQKQGTKPIQKARGAP